MAFQPLPRLSLRRLAIFSAVAAGLLTTPSLAQTVTWDGGGDGVTWSDARNWNHPDFLGPPLLGNVVPGPSALAVIPAGTGRVLVNSPVEVMSISTLRRLEVVDGSLIVGTTIGSGDTLRVAGASLLRVGTGLLGGILQFEGGQIDGPLSITAVTVRMYSTNPAVFRGSGTCTLVGNLAVGQSFTVEASGGHTAGLTLSSTTTVNDGTLALTSVGTETATLTIAGPLLNRGTFTLASPAGAAPATISSFVTNEGVMNLNRATHVTGSGRLVNRAQLNLGAQLFALGETGTYLVQESGAVSGASNIFFYGSLRYTGGTIIGEPEINGTLSIGASASAPVTFRIPTGSFAGVLHAGQRLAVGRSGVGMGIGLTVFPGATLEGDIDIQAESRSTMILTLSGPVVNTGTISVRRMPGDPASSISPTAIVAGTLTNLGSMQFDVPVVLRPYYGASMLTNQGSLRFSAALTSAEGSTLSNGFAQTAGSIIGAANMTLTGVSFNFAGGQLDGEPNLASCNISIDPAATDPVGLRLSGNSTLTGQLQAGQRITSSAAAHETSTLNLPDPFISDGTLTLTAGPGGTSSATAPGAAISGGELYVGPGSVLTAAGLTLGAHSSWRTGVRGGGLGDFGRVLIAGPAQLSGALEVLQEGDPPPEPCNLKVPLLVASGSITGVLSPIRLPQGSRLERSATQLAFTTRSLADVAGLGGPPALPDGLLTGDDFVAFINAFSAGESLADIVAVGGFPEPDGLLTSDDFVAFTSAFALGCP